jgi:hypothetical protein
MNASPGITITPIHVADLLAEGELMPVYVHLIDHPDGRVLVDTGMTELHPGQAGHQPAAGPFERSGRVPGLSDGAYFSGLASDDEDWDISISPSKWEPPDDA